MRTPEFIHKGKQTNDENRGQSMRSIAKKLRVSEKTIKSVHEDIRYKSYIIKRDQFISEKLDENRLNRSRWLKQTQKSFPQSAGTVEYTDCFSTGVWNPSPTSILHMTLNNMIVRF